MASGTEWIETLSPWPAEFGLDRMRSLLARLGEPQRAFASVHVVGTNGKSTAARTVEELLRADGRRTGAYLSPHVRRWAERIRIDGQEADFEEAVERVRPPAEHVGATQFEALTAAAFAAFADAEVEVAAVEAGLGGRLDATNVVDAPVVLLTNVSREHTEVLGETPEEIAREKLAVAHAASVVVVPDNSFARFVPEGRARVVAGGAREAAEAFAGHAIDAEPEVVLPGRLERRGDEMWDGAHNAAGAEWLAARLDPPYVVVASILRDKDAGAMLAALSRLGPAFVATSSSSPRALPADELAAAARRWFADVEAVSDPVDAVARARARSRRILVTGSLYLLADLAHEETPVP